MSYCTATVAATTTTAPVAVTATVTARAGAKRIACSSNCNSSCNGNSYSAFFGVRKTTTSWIFLQQKLRGSDLSSKLLRVHELGGITYARGKERERKRNRERLCVRIYVCVRACVCVRERERELKVVFVGVMKNHRVEIDVHSRHCTDEERTCTDSSMMLQLRCHVKSMSARSSGCRCGYMTNGRD